MDMFDPPVASPGFRAQTGEREIGANANRLDRKTFGRFLSAILPTKQAPVLAVGNYWAEWLSPDHSVCFACNSEEDPVQAEGEFAGPDCGTAGSGRAGAAVRRVVLTVGVS